MATSADLPQPAAAGPANVAANLQANLLAVLDDVAPRPLIRDDTAGPYDALHAHILAEVKPCGIIERIWVRDFGDLAFDVLRLRHLKAEFMSASTVDGLRHVLRDLGTDDYLGLAKRWHGRQPDAVAAVEAALAAARLGPGVVRAKGLAAHIDIVEAFDRAIRGAEARRDAMLAQLYRHQADLAERLRRATAAHAQVVDAEFTPVPPQTGQHPEAYG